MLAVQKSLLKSNMNIPEKQSVLVNFMQKLDGNLLEADSTVKKCQYSSITGRFQAPPNLLENQENTKVGMSHLKKQEDLVLVESFPTKKIGERLQL